MKTTAPVSTTSPALKEPWRCATQTTRVTRRPRTRRARSQKQLVIAVSHQCWQKRNAHFWVSGSQRPVQSSGWRKAETPRKSPAGGVRQNKEDPFGGTAEVDASLVAHFNLHHPQGHEPNVGQQLLAGWSMFASLRLPRCHLATRGWRRQCRPPCPCVWCRIISELCRADQCATVVYVLFLLVTGSACLSNRRGTVPNLRQRREHRPLSTLGAFPANSMAGPEAGRSSGEDFSVFFVRRCSGNVENCTGAATDGRPALGT